MYDMYPDAWLPDGRRQPQVVTDHPRRRARKTHSVLPPVLSADVEASLPAQPSRTELDRTLG